MTDKLKGQGLPVCHTELYRYKNLNFENDSALQYFVTDDSETWSSNYGTNFVLFFSLAHCTFHKTIEHLCCDKYNVSIVHLVQLYVVLLFHPKKSVVIFLLNFLRNLI